MKNLILLVAIVFGVLTTNAQSTSIKNKNSVDTLVNADTVYYTLPATAGYSAAAFQPVVSKVTGTVAGKAYLSGSVDGTNYVLTDSITISNVALNTGIWAKTTTPYTYYRVTFITSSGTAVPKLYYVFKRYY